MLLLGALVGGERLIASFSSNAAHAAGLKRLRFQRRMHVVHGFRAYRSLALSLDAPFSQTPGDEVYWHLRTQSRGGVAACARTSSQSRNVSTWVSVDHTAN